MDRKIKYSDYMNIYGDLFFGISYFVYSLLIKDSVVSHDITYNGKLKWRGFFHVIALILNTEVKLYLVTLKRMIIIMKINTTDEK